jgi:serine/threonine-protein kinase
VPLVAGSRLSAYEIISLLGAGSMGEVYRALDTDLKRQVAIKVLPASLAGDTERLARFQREAEVLAALNHPNIAHIHGLEKADGIIALVMELVEGPTLADRIAQGPIPLDEALPIARQITEALEAAHEQGIIHRDLKPANIKVRSDGMVKVLDFGLAKAMETTVAGEGGNHSLTNSPTITSPAMLTGVGMLLGTAAYMSPEQAKGRPVDTRSDVWAFGVVLYEMLTGMRPFGGDDVGDTIAAVLRQDVNWTALSPSTPTAVRWLLARCLNRDVKNRLRDIGEARIVLADPQASRTVETSSIGSLRLPWTYAAALALVSLVVGALIGASIWFAMRPEPPQVVWTTISTSGASALEQQGIDLDVAITPDGRQVVYRASNRLVVRALDTLEPRVLDGLGSPRGPFISPDGEWLGFVDGTVMKKVLLKGGPVAVIASIGDNPRGATWGPDGTIIFATGTIATGLQRVDASGGEPALLTTPIRERELDHLWPEFLPGGRAVLYTIPSLTRSVETSKIAVLDLQTGVSKTLITGGSHAHYVPSGHLVYGAVGGLFAVGFDLEHLSVKGMPSPVLDGVVTTVGGATDIAIASNGTMVYVPGRGDGVGPLTVLSMDREGRALSLPNLPADAYRDVRVSPNGAQLALATQDDIWIYDIARAGRTKLTTDPAPDIAPMWTLDGKRIVFTSRRAGYSELFWRPADGSGSEERLLSRSHDSIDLNANSWSRDGSHLLFAEVSSNKQVVASIEQLSIAHPEESQVLLKNDANHGRAAVSPDGRWLAYESNRSGRTEVYVDRYPSMEDRRPVSIDGGRLPLWGSNGQELFFVSLDGRQMFVVPVQTGPTFVAARPRVLFDPGMQPIQGGSRPADVAPDGRFFVIRSAAADAGGRALNLVVVQNWFEELKRLVPTR